MLEQAVEHTVDLTSLERTGHAPDTAAVTIGPLDRQVPPPPPAWDEVPPPPPVWGDAPAPAPPAESPIDQVGDVDFDSDPRARLVMMDLSGHAPAPVNAPDQAPVRLLGGGGEEAPSHSAGWVSGTGPARRNSGRVALVAACVAATVGVGAAVVLTSMNAPETFRVELTENGEPVNGNLVQPAGAQDTTTSTSPSAEVSGAAGAVAPVPAPTRSVNLAPARRPGTTSAPRVVGPATPKPKTPTPTPKKSATPTPAKAPSPTPTKAPVPTPTRAPAPTPTPAPTKATQPPAPTATVPPRPTAPAPVPPATKVPTGGSSQPAASPG